MEVPGAGVESEQQLPTYDAAVTLLDPLAHCTGLRIEPAVPQWELLHNQVLKWYH